MDVTVFKDTIFALSSGRLPAGVAVVRLSGPRAADALVRLCGKLPPPRVMAYARLDAADGTRIDSGLVVHLPAPATFTGEDCVEMHVHGGRAVVTALLAELGSLPGLRHAETGEFTRRAHMLGKLDLPQAEALADLVAAETEAQRRFAIANGAGERSGVYDGWRNRLIHARAMIEAELDFADEDDVPGSVADTVWKDMSALLDEITRHVDGYRHAEIIRDGFRVAIVGAPNAGKSSLLNALSGREAAIVSDQPGTTRDLVEVALDLDGVKVVVTDTAGLREASDSVEREGMARARKAAAAADLVLLLEDVMAVDAAPPVSSSGEVARVGTKIDLVDGTVSAGGGDRQLVRISTRTGEGLDTLVALISARAARAAALVGESVPFTTRQRDELVRACTCLSHATDDGLALELRAEELRRASDALGRVIGTIGVEDVLDAVFSRFCIGK